MEQIREKLIDLLQLHTHEQWNGTAFDMAIEKVEGLQIHLTFSYDIINSQIFLMAIYENGIELERQKISKKEYIQLHNMVGKMPAGLTILDPYWFSVQPSMSVII